MRKYSLTSRVLVYVILAVFVQMAGFLCTIQFTGTFSRLDESTISTFQTTVRDRANRLQEYMNSWAEISEDYSAINDIIFARADEKGTTVSELMQSPGERQIILSNSLPVLLECQDSNETSMVYMILDTKSEKKDAICLEDQFPGEHSVENRDVLALSGAPGPLQDERIAFASSWSARLDISGHDEYYHVPFNAGNKYVNIDGTDLGVYTGMNTLVNGGRSFIGYSIPLLDEEHRSIGVFGIGVTSDYLSRILSDGAISIDEDASFILGFSNGDSESIRNVIVNGGRLSKLIPTGSIIELKETPEGLYQPRSDDVSLGDQSLDGYTLQLYANNSPYEDHIWMAGNFISTEALHISSGNLFNGLVIAVIFALIIGVILAVIISLVFSRPIKKVIAGLRSLTISSPEIPSTGAREIDFLAGEVNNRNRELFESASVLANTLEYSAVPMGVLEYREREDNYLITARLFDILGIKRPDTWKDNFITTSDFESAIRPYLDELRPVEEEGENIYSIIVGEELRYIQVNVSDNENVKVYIDVTDNISDKIRIRHERDFDALTNIYNRRAFERAVRSILEHGNLEHAYMSVWDLDNLKTVNDTYGHDIGDRYIQALPEVFQNHFPAENSIIARRSGDEFFVFLYNEAPEVMKKRLEDAHHYFVTYDRLMARGRYLATSVSAGIAEYSRGDTYEKLELAADFAMYDAKRTTKGTIHMFDPVVFERDQILLKGGEEFARIIDEGNIRYQYQPIVDPYSGKVFGFEALMEPISDVIHNATELIRIAESQSMLDRMEKYTWTHALRDFLALYGEEAKRYRLFIKTLPNQCLSDSEFFELEQEFGENMGILGIETVENARVDDVMEERKRRWCRKWNASLVLDDYGSGYSNNDMLTKHEYEYIKVSIGLVKDIDKDRNTQILLKGIIDFCHSNSQTVIAEGVETKAEMEVLMSLGIDLVQGYLLAKPGRQGILNISGKE